MSGLYGSWLSANFDYSAVKGRIDSLHTEFYPKYERRVAAIEKLATMFVEEMEATGLGIKGYLRVSYTNILAMVGRYLNDIVHYKVWHEITDSKPSKMLAHVAKWAYHYPPVVTAVNKEQYEAMNKSERELLLSINFIFIKYIFEYILQGFNKSMRRSNAYERIFYLLETNQYDARNATLVFEELMSA
ncbi:hypothetical protein GSF04_08155 [Pseudoalteromonas sp. A22]|uniref:hypothetical protein n=1 Tax=Pseudoalteromonas sp. A22 TaxID=327511 RepID=UPI001BA4AB9B|nr:hypothetical protein [Pseudoalteromonas sp. A22]QUI62488.1 hypothetical protein GSF04_08155 [Pseudoalteromonas sp. A22]